MFWGKRKKQKFEEGVAAEEKLGKSEEVPEAPLIREKVGCPPIFGVLLRPQTTEKSSASSERGKYVFIVASRTNKNEVKRAVESRYNVNVKSVNILKMPGKERRRGKQIGWKSGYKKAIVTLKSGQSIEVQ